MGGSGATAAQANGHDRTDALGSPHDAQWHLLGLGHRSPAAGAGRARRAPACGRTRSDPRMMLNGIFWVLGTGAPWRDLPERYGPWQTVYDHFRKWRQSGVFTAIVEALQIRLDQQGKIDWELWCVDGAWVGASRAAAGAEKKVVPAMRQSRKTTHWAAAAAGLDRKSICIHTDKALPWRTQEPPER